MWKELFRESVKIDEKTLRTKLYGMTTFKSWEEIIVSEKEKKKRERNDQRHKMKINVTEIKETGKGIEMLLNVLETKLDKNFAWHLRQV